MSHHAPAPIRHGEILLMPCDAPDPASTGSVERLAEAVVGHSETGHHHMLECPAVIEVIHADGTYVRLSEPGTLVQRKETERHRDLPVPAGLYKVLTKTTYDPFADQRRAVID